MRTVRIALGAGLTLLGVAIVLVLLHSPAVVARKNGTPRQEHRIALTRSGANICQADELVPAGTSAIRLWLGANTGPRVSVKVLAGGQVLTSGTASSGWTGRLVTVPLQPLPQALPAATICVSFPLQDEQLLIFGQSTPHAAAAHFGRRPLEGRMWIEYMHPGSRSWMSLALSVARRMGLGRVPAGTWLAVLALCLLVAVAVAASVLVLEELREPS